MVTRVCLTPTPTSVPIYIGALRFIPGGRVQYISLHPRLHSVVYKALKQKCHAPGCRIATPSEVLWNTVPNKLKSEKCRWNLWSCRKGVLHCLWIGHSQRQSHLRDGGNHRKQWLLKNTLAAKNLIPILWKSAVVPSVIHQPSAFLEVVKLERVAFVQMNKHHREESTGLSWVEPDVIRHLELLALVVSEISVSLSFPAFHFSFNNRIMSVMRKSQEIGVLSSLTVMAVNSKCVFYAHN